MSDFAIFITSHGSPNKCETLDSLKAAGYTGEWYIVIDDLDCVDQYREIYGDRLLVFHKMFYVNGLDIGMSHTNPQLAAVLYARAAVEDFAVMLGLQYFIVTDDDLVGFRFRYPVGNSLKSFNIVDMDRVIGAYIYYMQHADICCLSFANDGSFIGGISAVEKILSRRSCHTIFLRNVSRPLDWSFAINEDYITSLRHAQTGYIMLTLPFVQRSITGMNNRHTAGMSQMYATTSDFQRAFYATIARPDACKPQQYNGKYVIGVDKKAAYPKIISDKHKKGVHNASV